MSAKTTRLQGSSSNSTICAVSTAPGQGAIGVVRLSGDKTISIINAVFSKDLSMVQSHTVHHGFIKHGEKVLDEVVVTVFKDPHSYTGEDVVEISCHGSSYILRELVHLLVQQGATPAGPGEFSQRAFLNGKMDLSQVEAVADLIAANAAGAHKVAMNQMRGGFSKKIAGLREELIKFASLLELELDFSEEDVEFADRKEFFALLQRIRAEVDALIESFKLGNVLKNGVPVVIIGVPNVGKSTLLNVLLNENRAIVSEIPGTTRDAIEDEVVIDGMLFRFIDTAGIRETKDHIELIGIEKTWEKVNEAEIIIYLFDAREYAQAEKFITALQKKIAGKGKKLIPVANKSDLATDLPEKVISISATGGKNIDKLKALLVDYVSSLNHGNYDIIVTSARHVDALQQVRTSVDAIEKAMKDKLPGDLVAVDVRKALHQLGLITGTISTEDLLGFVFSKFCIGK
ncbi:MAG: tRNA uridine-5-carboxymethylaminomethyl(34) synthesis GTPase MnmE [Flavobacteriales bacterium]